MSYTRDAIGRLIGVEAQGTDGITLSIVSGRTYRADGLWTSQSYSNGLTQTKQYDTQGRLLSHVAGTYSRDYVYDANGNIVSADAIDNSQERDCQYDVLDRLTNESDSVRSLIRDYLYDANGNREQFSESSLVTPLTYEANTNRLDTINGSNIVLDASGRTLSDASGRSFTYDDLGRLTQVELNGQLVGQYLYDYQQLRSQKEVAGTLTVYHYDLSGNLIAESDRLGNTSIEYVYADGERVAAILPDNSTPPAESGVQYYINDHLMTPKQAVNQNNSVTWSAEYTAFGKVDISVELFVNNHRFPGQYFDQGTGLYYNWNRYYGSETGRYVTSDSIGLAGGLNTYGYVGGNPLRYSDRFGLLDPDKPLRLKPQLNPIKPVPPGGGAGVLTILGKATLALGLLIHSEPLGEGSDVGESQCSDDDEPKCDPPEGTICSEFHSGGTPHKVRDIDNNLLEPQGDHVHTWRMNKSPKGCIWNKARKQTFNYTPVNAKACSSYPSWHTNRSR